MTNDTPNSYTSHYIFRSNRYTQPHKRFSLLLETLSYSKKLGRKTSFGHRQCAIECHPAHSLCFGHQRMKQSQNPIKLLWLLLTGQNRHGSDCTCPTSVVRQSPANRRTGRRRGRNHRCRAVRARKSGAAGHRRCADGGRSWTSLGT